jgi:Profilin
VYSHSSRHILACCCTVALVTSAAAAVSQSIVSLHSKLVGVQANETSHYCTHSKHLRFYCCSHEQKLLQAAWRLPEFCFFTHAIVAKQKPGEKRKKLLCNKLVRPLAAPSSLHLLSASHTSKTLQQRQLVCSSSFSSTTPSHQHKQSNMSGWDAYVQTQLIASGAISQGAILGKADLQLYAQEGGFEVSETTPFYPSDPRLLALHLLKRALSSSRAHY